MTVGQETRRPRAGKRRAGYLIGALVNVLVLLAAHAWPGWEAVPFLTGDTPRVLGVVDLALTAGVATNVAFLGYDPEWLTALGGLVTTLAGLVAVVRVWQVFPFDFAGSSFDWPVTARVLLVVGIAGSVLGALVQLATLVRAGLRRR
ncbi:hypothetical protein [Amycolatopsis sp. cg9]|uniref:hypothetical protein n=1 Tax=Amycolatopsis sp. cg9 TaxID=3238801 RepID=UPI003524F8F2